ncbi:MAG: polymer-forming cytoskeletal protein [Acidiferrobacterales bacterium]
MSDAREKKANGKPCDSIDTLIGSKTEVKGTLVFSGGLRVDGKMKGNITARSHDNSTVVLSERAEVNGNVTVPHVILQGRIKGNVRSSECIEVQRTAEIAGDVRYKTIEIARGATIRGSLLHEAEERADKGVVARLRPAATTRPSDPTAEGGG